MDPLNAALQPVARLLNRNIRETTPALELCRELDGTVIAIRVRNTGLAAWLLIDNDTIIIADEFEAEPDVILTGSLLTLASLATRSAEDAIRTGSLELSGDTLLAQRFQKLMALAKPDLEEELSAVVGDVAAHRLGEIARGIGRWSQHARRTMGANIREYLQEESGDLPSRYDVERFAAELGTLRDDVDRAEARMNRLLDRL